MSKKNAILSTAIQLFARNGFKNTSMAELSKTTGVAGGTIFHHFKNKEDIFLTILKEVKNSIISSFGTHIANNSYKTGLEMVVETVSFYLHLASTMEDHFLLLHRHEPYKLAETNIHCRQYLQEIYDCLLDIFEKGIEKGQKDGSIKDMPARNTAMIIFSMVDGLVRFNTYNLYSAGALYNDLILSCRKILISNNP